MSRELFSRSPDLKLLRDEGYFVLRQGGQLVMREVPYVDARREVRFGTLISSLTLAGDATRRPDTHVVHWDGDFPCRADGTPIQGISHQAGTFHLGHGLKATHSFSSKPDGGYSDYHHKMTSYANIIAGPASVLKPGATPRTFREPEPEEDSVFNFIETASDRVGIGVLTERLVNERVAIIGGGIAGCSTALHISLRGVPVVLLEKRQAGAAASGVNFGGVRRNGRALAELDSAV